MKEYIYLFLAFLENQKNSKTSNLTLTYEIFNAARMYTAGGAVEYIHYIYTFICGH